MIRLRCEDCGTHFYSAAARSMVERGERCSNCSGALLLDDPDEQPEPEPAPELCVGANGDDRPAGGDRQ